MYLRLPLWQWGAGNICLLLFSSWKVNIVKKTHCNNGVVDTFRQCVPGLTFAQFVYCLREVCLLFHFWMIPVTLLHSLMDKSYKVSDVVSIVTRLMRWQHLVSTALTQSINARSYALQVLTSTDFITWSTSAFIERIKAVETRCCRCINHVMTDTTSVSKVLKIQMDSSNSGWTVSFEHHCTKQQQQ